MPAIIYGDKDLSSCRDSPTTYGDTSYVSCRDVIPLKVFTGGAPPDSCRDAVVTPLGNKDFDSCRDLTPWLLAEDGTPLLAEDGTFLRAEG